jgi:hypothetical protein
MIDTQVDLAQQVLELPLLSWCSLTDRQLSHNILDLMQRKSSRACRRSSSVLIVGTELWI